MSGDGGCVGGLVELEVLGVIGLLLLWLLLLRVILGHGGRGGERGEDQSPVRDVAFGAREKEFLGCDGGMFEAVMGLGETCFKTDFLKMPIGLRSLGAKVG